MSYALTTKSQVTVPKAIREHLNVLPGGEVDYEPLPDGSARMFAVQPPKFDNPFRQFLGVGIRKRPTEEIMRETRGEDAMR